MTGTRLPFTSVVPSRFDRNGFVCATSCAKSGAARLRPTTTTSMTNAAIAGRLRRRRRRASRQGPAAVERGASAATAVTPLLHPRLIEEPVELLAEDEVADALREEVEVLRVEERHHRRRVRHLAVD